MKRIFEVALGREVYALDVGKCFGVSHGFLWMIYAPLSRCKLIVRKPQLEVIRERIASGCASDVTQLLKLDDYTTNTVRPKHHAEFTTLYIIPTHKCNFSCVYCYSANYREKKTLSKAAMITFIEYFLARESAPKTLKVVFVGGGEPFLAWNIIVAGVSRIRDLENKFELNVKISIITNVSLLNEAKMEFIKKHRIAITASFDILESVQNEQRGHFGLVTGKLKQLDRANIPYQIQTTIMPNSITRMVEMVRDVAHNYPSAQGIVFEMVRGGDFFKDARDITEYIKRFATAWSAVQREAAKCGVKVFNSFFSAKDIIRSCYCGGMYVLTPYADISVCVHISHIRQKGYIARRIGHVESDGVCIDEQAFSNAYRCAILESEQCSKCWAKWNCAGGCPNARYMYNKSILKAICQNTKKYLLEGLVNDLRVAYAKNHGGSLDQVVVDNYKMENR